MSYMTLHPIPSELPYTIYIHVYEENFLLFFISVNHLTFQYKMSLLPLFQDFGLSPKALS
jgi:hypothetical protein